MNIRFCRLADVTVRTLDGLGRSFGFGAIVDLDDVIGESHGEPVTLEAALGDLVEHFTLEAPVAAAVQPSPVLDTVEDGAPMEAE